MVRDSKRGYFPHHLPVWGPATNTAMPAEEFDEPQSDDIQSYPAIPCDECQAAFESGSQQAISFLLLDQLTMPLLSCDHHLEQFTSICGLTTEGTADILHHRPAGGIPCPGCRLAPYDQSQPMIPVQDGAIAVVACPEHQSEIVDRFRTGLQTQQQLTTTLDTNDISF